MTMVIVNYYVVVFLIRPGPLGREKKLREARDFESVAMLLVCGPAPALQHKHVYNTQFVGEE